MNTEQSQLIVNVFFALTFLVMVGTSTTLFHYLKCHEFIVPDADGGGTRRFLFKDYSIDCDSARYKAYVPFVMLMMLIYPFGIPFLYYNALFAFKDTLSNQAAVDREAANGYPTIGHLKFLFLSYRPETFYFEAVDCGRRLTLASAVGVLDADSAAAPVLGLLICFVFNYVFTEVSPYKKPEDNDLAVVLAKSLTMIYLSALMTKTGATDPDSAAFGLMMVGVMMTGPVAIAVQNTIDKVKKFVEKVKSIAERILGMVPKEKLLAMAEKAKEAKEKAEKLKAKADEAKRAASDIVPNVTLSSGDGEPNAEGKAEGESKGGSVEQI